MDRKLTILIRCLIPVCFLLIGSPLKALASTASHPLPSHKQEMVATKPSKPQGETPVQARLIAEDQSIQPGHPFWVGVELKMAEGWDTYWINPGDVGFPTKVDWHLPEASMRDLFIGRTPRSLLLSP